MSSGRRRLALALVPMLLLGGTLGSAEGSTVVGASEIPQLQAAGVSPALFESYFWGPYFYPSFGWGVTYSYGPSPDGNDGNHVQAPPHAAVPIELHVNPRKATIVVDGTSLGQARDFSSRAYPLWLQAGTHDLELSYKGYQTLRVRFEAKPGRAYRIHYDLRAGEGLDPRSSGGSEQP